ncbi:unnamed protein product [Somion occarium]|uniref:F-box domain-containing protein n=1 Tax=Somion occarium TaxID=3059160 RepID=A0ABP1CV71_9APHY
MADVSIPSGTTSLIQSGAAHVDHKQHKKKTKLKKSSTQEEIAVCHLGRMPLEILAEILSYTCSPRDVLALARCNKFFCHTLVQPSSAFIWKHARARCKPSPIPDPTPNYTEAAYASLIFDGGECEVCGNKTSDMLISFNIRLRLCSKGSCKEKWRSTYSQTIKTTTVHHRYHPLVQWMPAIEDRAFTHQALVSSSMFRLKDWQNAVDEYNKALLSPDTTAIYIHEKEVLARRLPDIIAHGLNLVAWRRQRESRLVEIEGTNMQRSKEIAARNGWNLWNMRQSPIFDSLFRARSRSLETITNQDIEFIRPTLESQIIEMADRAQRRQAEDNTRKRREAVEHAYARLKSMHPQQAFPALAEFRKLPTAQLVQKGTGPMSAEDLKESPLIYMLSQDLEQWRSAAKEGLSSVLGYPGWRHASSLKLHPVERMTARFKCKLCEGKKADEAHWKSYGLDFKAACEHRCEHLSAKQKDKAVFKADDFLPDHKATRTVEQVLTQLGRNAEDAGSRPQLLNLNIARIKCLSCEANVLMNFDDMLRHCKRHETVAFELITPEQALLLEHPYVKGLRAKLMEHTKSALNLRGRKVYACRHCPPKTPATQAQASMAPNIQDAQSSDGAPKPDRISTDTIKKDETSSRVENTDKSRRQKPNAHDASLFNFDGLRSHVKCKHGIAWIGDEDFYQVEPTVGRPIVIS